MSQSYFKTDGVIQNPQEFQTFLKVLEMVKSEAQRTRLKTGDNPAFGKIPCDELQSCSWIVKDHYIPSTSFPGDPTGASSFFDQRLTSLWQTNHVTFSPEETKKLRYAVSGLLLAHLYRDHTGVDGVLQRFVPGVYQRYATQEGYVPLVQMLWYLFDELQQLPPDQGLKIDLRKGNPFIPAVAKVVQRYNKDRAFYKLTGSAFQAIRQTDFNQLPEKAAWQKLKEAILIGVSPADRPAHYQKPSKEIFQQGRYLDETNIIEYSIALYTGLTPFPVFYVKEDLLLKGGRETIARVIEAHAHVSEKLADWPGGLNQPLGQEIRDLFTLYNWEKGEGKIGLHSETFTIPEAEVEKSLPPVWKEKVGSAVVTGVDLNLRYFSPEQQVAHLQHEAFHSKIRQAQVAFGYPADGSTNFSYLSKPFREGDAVTFADQTAVKEAEVILMAAQYRAQSKKLSLPPVGRLMKRLPFGRGYLTAAYYIDYVREALGGNDPFHQYRMEAVKESVALAKRKERPNGLAQFGDITVLEKKLGKPWHQIEQEANAYIADRFKRLQSRPEIAEFIQLFADYARANKIRNKAQKKAAFKKVRMDMQNYRSRYPTSLMAPSVARFLAWTNIRLSELFSASGPRTTFLNQAKELIPETKVGLGAIRPKDQIALADKLTAKGVK